MPEPDEVADLAARLRALKDRTDRSYDALARRAGISSSALHRYCSGSSVPTEYTVVERFGKACGANQQELLDLHRAWVLADYVRSRSHSHSHSRTALTPDGEQLAADGSEAAGDAAPDIVLSSRAEPRSVLEESRWRSWLALVAVLTSVAFFGLWVSSAATPWDRTAEEAPDTPMLLSKGCPVVVSMGEHDHCVRALQTLLNGLGAKLVVDGNFGPRTLMRVVAFQALAGLPVNGVVDERTKRALYSAKVDLSGAPPEQVTRRIREVFREQPDRAVGIARCQSYLDPLWVLPNTNGTRNWGVFQLSDARLRDLGGTPQQALDLEWNIQAAHRLWQMRGGFSDWVCDQAYQTAEPTPIAGSSPAG